VGLPVAGPRHVEDLLEALAALRPALDDLDAVEIARRGILHRPHDERRRLALHGREIAAHRHATAIRCLHPILLGEEAGAVIPSSEEAHLDAGTARAEGFLAVHRVPDRRTRVLLSPHAGEPRRVLETHVQTAEEVSGHPRLDGPVVDA